MCKIKYSLNELKDILNKKYDDIVSDLMSKNEIMSLIDSVKSICYSYNINFSLSNVKNY